MGEKSVFSGKRDRYRGRRGSSLKQFTTGVGQNEGKLRFIFMKKILVMIGIGIAAWVSLTGCGEKEKAVKRMVTPVRLDYDGRNANKVMLKLWEAFEGKDREAVKELFSAEAINEIEECDSKIDSLLDFIQGEIVKCEKYLLTSSMGRCAGKTQYEIGGGYIITTTEENYLLTFSLVTRDELNKENIGIYRIDILTKEMSESDNDWGGNNPDICIYAKEEE